MNKSQAKLTCQLNLGIIKIHGPDSVKFLQNTITCDVSLIDENMTSCGALCNPKGRILINFILFKINLDFYLALPKDMVAIFLKKIKKYALFSKVEINDVSNQWHTAGIITKPAELFKLESNTTIKINHPAGTLLLSNNPIEADQNEKPWALANIAAGFANIHPDTCELFTPHMINLQKFNGVSFSKGCYIGQEIIARTEHLGKLKRHLHQISIQPDQEIAPGAKITNPSGDEIGTVLNSAKDKHDIKALAAIEDRALDETTLMVNNQAIKLIQ